jgi:putative hydrolase of the HAD superfamily
VQPRGVRAVLLDFGGTLFSYRNMNGPTVRLLLAAAERLGVEVDAAKAVEAYRRGSRDAWLRYMPRPFYLHRDLFRDTFRRFAESLGAAAGEELLGWLHVEQRRLAVEHLALREGCVETLRELRGAGLHVAVVSNIDEDYLEPMLERSGLASLVDARTSSEEAGSCKPDPAIFRHALAKGGLRPGEALFVGDSPEADVFGARRVGMTTVLIRDPSMPPPGAGAGPSAEADHVIRELPELLPIVRARLGA